MALFVLVRDRLLSIERPIETALLASLAGIKCFYGNQWHCRLKDNADKLSTVLQGSLFIHFIKLTAVKVKSGLRKFSAERSSTEMFTYNLQTTLIGHRSSIKVVQ